MVDERLLNWPKNKTAPLRTPSLPHSKSQMINIILRIMLSSILAFVFRINHAESNVMLTLMNLRNLEGNHVGKLYICIITTPASSGGS